MQEKSMKKITLSLDTQTLDLMEKYMKEHFLNSKSQVVRVLVNKDARDSENNRGR